ncbi:hypothetical protein RDI58_024065 [Solanum bulbocastanum]
MSLIT